MTVRFYAAQKYDFLGDSTATQDFASDFARFLVNDLPTFTGPGWTIIEAYDATTNDRQVPVTATDMDSFVGTFSWKDNTVSPNDWIVLQSILGANEFQVFFRFLDTTANGKSNQLEVQLIPLGNWTTNVGSPTTSPTKPGTVVPATPIVIDQPNVGGTTPLRAAYSIVADEGMFTFLWDSPSASGSDGTPANRECFWTYVGNMDASRLSDTRPYVIGPTAPAQVRWDRTSFTTGFFARLSPLDADVATDTGTVLTNGFETVMSCQPLGNIQGSGTGFKRFDELRALPVGLFFPDTNQRHFVGYFRNVYSAHRLLGPVGTFGTLAYMFRNDAIQVVDDLSLCFEWDGVTPYPTTFP
jgi:hypothetical protein